MLRCVEDLLVGEKKMYRPKTRAMVNTLALAVGFAPTAAYGDGFTNPSSWATYDYSESDECVTDQDCVDPHGYNVLRSNAPSGQHGQLVDAPFVIAGAEPPSPGDTTPIVPRCHLPS